MGGETMNVSFGWYLTIGSWCEKSWGLFAVFQALGNGPHDSLDLAVGAKCMRLKLMIPEFKNKHVNLRLIC